MRLCCIIFQKLSKSQKRVEELEKARLANLPVDAAKEIADMKALLVSHLNSVEDGCIIKTSPYIDRSS